MNNNTTIELVNHDPVPMSTFVINIHCNVSPYTNQQDFDNFTAYTRIKTDEIMKELNIKYLNQIKIMVLPNTHGLHTCISFRFNKQIDYIKRDEFIKKTNAVVGKVTNVDEIKYTWSCDYCKALDS